jgi:hypothetical protein
VPFVASLQAVRHQAGGTVSKGAAWRIHFVAARPRVLPVRGWWRCSIAPTAGRGVDLHRRHGGRWTTATTRLKEENEEKGGFTDGGGKNGYGVPKSTENLREGGGGALVRGGGWDGLKAARAWAMSSDTAMWRWRGTAKEQGLAGGPAQINSDFSILFEFSNWFEFATIQNIPSRDRKISNKICTRRELNK